MKKERVEKERYHLILEKEKTEERENKKKYTSATVPSKGGARGSREGATAPLDSSKTFLAIGI